MIIAIVGPTAGGKSDFAIELATEYGKHIGLPGSDAVEIVSADAMQLYRGMDIGTAKLPIEARNGIRHHQIDELDIFEEASVATYQLKARADIASIKKANRLPMVVGGSGLYLRALLDSMQFPPTDPSVRSRLEEQLSLKGSLALHAELFEKDPQAAASIDKNNGRRVVRALEVIELTGRPYTATLPKRESIEPTIQIGISREPEDLEKRIRRRTELMFEEGLVEEVEELRDRGLAETKTAARATGYAQVLSMLRGEISENEAKESIALATWQLAKRQIKWFKPDPRITWLGGGDDGSLSSALEVLLDSEDSEPLF